ncbi:MAG: hypothetical protein ACPGUV_13750, partial [Polyangiales bacterium]
YETYLHITTNSGQILKFDVELALNEKEQAKGLMYRKFLPDDSGMAAHTGIQIVGPITGDGSHLQYLSGFQLNWAW